MRSERSIMLSTKAIRLLFCNVLIKLYYFVRRLCSASKPVISGELHKRKPVSTGGRFIDQSRRTLAGHEYTKTNLKIHTPESKITGT